MNLATPVGKGSAILGAVVLMVMIPAMCIWLILDEFTPIRLAVEDEILYAKHLNVDYEIQVKILNMLRRSQSFRPGVNQVELRWIRWKKEHFS